MRSLLFVCMFMAASFPAIAQSKGSALKFDEFTDKPDAYYFFDNEITFRERLTRLVNQLKRVRGKKVHVIYYRARIVSDRASSKSRLQADRAKWEIFYRAGVKYEDIELIDGGIRDENTIEFWISAKNGDPPKPTPTYLQSESVVCPSIYVTPERPVFNEGEPLVLNAGRYPEADGGVCWTISEGRVLEGQGKRSIRIDPVGAKRITAIAVFDGIKPPCDSSVIITTEIGLKPYLMDSFSQIEVSYLRARLDGFLASLMDLPNVHGYIFVYGSRTQDRSLSKWVRTVMNHLAFRRFPSERITVVSGGYRDYVSMDLWLVPPGADVPTPNPTVDSNFVRSRVKRRTTKKGP